MKFTVNRESLLRAMQLVSAGCAARTTKPILSQVKAVASGDTLTLTAQDMEIGIRYELCGVSVAGHGEAILAAPQLTSILRETDDDEVLITATDDGANVRLGASKFDMPGYPVNEYPDLPQWEDVTNYHELLAGDLRSLINRTSFAADRKDSTRFALSGVLWEVEGKTARAVATDSKRLAVCEVPATVFGVAPDGKHLLPVKALGLVENGLTDDGERVRVALRPNEAMFKTERAMIYTRLLEGRFPPYRDIINQTTKQVDVSLILPAFGFLARVKQAAVMAKDESSRMDLTFGRGKVVLEAKGAELGSSRVEMALPDYSGTSVTIAFDPKFLVEFLRVVVGENDSANVTLEMSDGSKPALFKAGENWRMLIMPLAG